MLGAVGTDMRAPIRAKVLQSGASQGGSFKYTTLFDASGNAVGQRLHPTQNGLTALAGGGQTGATQLNTGLNRVTTVATTADSGLLPVSAAGMVVAVKNAGANSMTIYPATGEAINALSANTGYALAAAKMVEFFCVVAGTWDTVLTA